MEQVVVESAPRAKGGDTVGAAITTGSSVHTADRFAPLGTVLPVRGGPPARLERLLRARQNAQLSLTRQVLATDRPPT
ncbi:hypothetical protein FAIPA1_460026 [Frankia sp. AiPs1]|uniref:hypothetical protein n=1 Tax=Frankia sp. AiPa1 TaxID=573492 RepID=UPI00202AE43B|nr:hypothetical protein [Frankia sp. AiPa1]MCL9760905.1 hypothetical protein [Frankia sp. AiPa1]